VARASADFDLENRQGSTAQPTPGKMAESTQPNGKRFEAPDGDEAVAVFYVASSRHSCTITVEGA